MSSRRSPLKDIRSESASHAGLWLDKYISTQSREDTEARSKLVEEVSKIPVPDIYKTFYDEWEKSLEACGASCGEATVNGRMIIGLGEESVLETSVTLHHTYGVPYIPGSAIKGAAAAYAHQYLEGEKWRIGGEFHKIIFGTTDAAGYITFFDALYKPGTGHKGQALYPDVITVHHQKYYNGDEGLPPADWDSTNPVPFLSATGQYLIALSCSAANDKGWLSLAFKIVAKALEVVGVGAKTSSGYGRLKLSREDTETTEEHTQVVDPEQEHVDEILKRLGELPHKQVPSKLGQLVWDFLNLELSNKHKRFIVGKIMNKIQESSWKNAKRKDWYPLLEQILNEE